MPHSQDYIRSLPEYDRHHFVTFLHDEASGMEAFVAIHRKNGTIPSFGATRLWHYESDSDALRDALRLSQLMSYKAALAGLPCGGAKGVILDRGMNDHVALLEAYSRHIAILKDSFVTGTDVGVRQEDLRLMKKYAPNIVGFNDNSTEFTALGLCHGIRAALTEVFSDSSLSQRTIAIQGLGKIGGAVLKDVVRDARRVYVSDIDESALSKVKDFPNVIVVPPGEIHKQKVDIFCPCAMGGAINTHNVAELSCAIIAGGANNQLERDDVGDILHKMGILYAPDYVVNAGGLVAVFDEYEHPDSYDAERVRNKVQMIEKRLRDIIAESRAQNRATNRVANEHAERTFNAYV